MTISFAPRATPKVYLNNQLLYWLVLFIACLAVTLPIYFKSLNSSLIFDDIAVQLYFSDPKFGWADCLLPLGNGFMRPIMMLIFKTLHHTIGHEPFWYHLASLVIHAAVATTTAFTFCVITGAMRRAGALVGLGVALASAAFPVVFMLSNSGDSIIAMGALLLISQWHRWLETGRSTRLILLGLALVVALSGKESGVAVGGIIVLQTWLARTARPKAWLIAAIVFTVCILYAMFAAAVQRSNEMSYANAGWVSYNPFIVFYRIISYLAAVAFPGTLIMEPMFSVSVLTPLFVQLVRVVAGALLLASAWAIFRRRAHPLVLQAAFFYAAAAGMLLPTAMLTMSAGPFSPIGRFLYSAIPLSMMAAGCLVARRWPTRRYARYLLVAVWCVWLMMQIWFVRRSPGTKEYYETAREWENFVSEMARLSPEWPPMQAVTVYTGPPHGSRPINESYGLALFRLYFPNLLADYFSNRTIPETTRAYVFNGKKMKLVPILPPGQ